MAVFEQSIEFDNRKPGDSAEAQLAAIRKEVLLSDDGDFGISDILGVFSYHEHMIKLFAQVIAYYSILLKVEAEDLAFVVLTHELAHAYTMAGYDINGYRGQLLIQPRLWNKYIIEGLAQYYTEAICHQLEKKFPQFKAAFDALLSGQTYPYTWYQDWFNRNKNHEGLRTLMIRYRDKQDAKEFRNYV